MKKLVALFVFISSLLWRPFFGGSFFHLTRFPKYILLWAIVIGFYYIKDILDWENLRMYAVCLAYTYHFARSHGDYFKVGDTSKDDGRIKWIDWLLRKIYGVDGYYNVKGNITGLFLRYFSTSILVCLAIPNALFCLAGIITPFYYWLGYKLAPTSCYTKIAEYLVSASTFYLLYICL